MTENGLLKYLKAVGKIDINPNNPSSSINEKEYLGRAKEADVVGLLVNKVNGGEDNSFEERVNDTREGWMYIHFGIVDRKDRSMVYQRPDIENKPEHTKWNDFVKYADEFAGMEMMVVFFNRV